MDYTVTKQELLARIEKFRILMDTQNPDWNTAFIINRVNQYYFTGTMQDGMLIIKREGTVAYLVRKSFERAKAESPLDWVYPMENYKDAAELVGADCENAYFELEVVPVGMLNRIKKYFITHKIGSLDRAMLCLRAVKSAYELYFMEESGRQHKHFLEDIVPTLLVEGISEADFIAEAFSKMYKLGYHGVSRFSMFQIELVLGQIAFGDNSIKGTSFDGPGGLQGLSAATPFGGSRERFLKKGDLVFVDIGYGVNGYHTDKTQIYSFGAQPNSEAKNAHALCLELEQDLAAMLIPGKIPSKIYEDFLPRTEKIENFMGFGARQAKFLGHGVGLVVDEYPIITNGFGMPLEENMIVALEPKIGIENIGMVGVEDTYVVTPSGGRCITGGGRDIIVI